MTNTNPNKNNEWTQGLQKGGKFYSSQLVEYFYHSYITKHNTTDATSGAETA